MGEIATLVERLIREGKKGREIVAAVAAIEDKREAEPAALFMLKQAFEDWNAKARQLGLPEAMTLTKPRQSKLRQRLAEAGGLDGWREALTRLGNSPFLVGDNDAGFRADLDFVLQAKSFTKLREGAYDRGPGRSKRSGADIFFESAREDIERAGFGQGRGQGDGRELAERVDRPRLY